MSDQTEFANMTPNQVWMGLAKLAISLAVFLLLAAFLVSMVIGKDGLFTWLTVNALLVAVALSVLANGVLAMLKIFDWFEARRKSENG